MSGYVRSMVVESNMNWTVGACASSILLHTRRLMCCNFLPQLVLSSYYNDLLCALCYSWSDMLNMRDGCMAM